MDAWLDYSLLLDRSSMVIGYRYESKGPEQGWKDNDKKKNQGMTGN